MQSTKFKTNIIWKLFPGVNKTTRQNHLVNFGSHFIYSKNLFEHIMLPLNENILLVERLKVSTFQLVCIRCFSLLYL